MGERDRAGGFDFCFSGNCVDVAVSVQGTNHVRMGDSPAISCDVTGASRVIRKWTFDPAFDLLGKNRTLVAGGHISFLYVDKSELSIHGATKSDEGRYYCHVSVLGQTIVKSADLFVIGKLQLKFMRTLKRNADAFSATYCTG